MEAPRVPAWKRLGLKLKYAQETQPASLPLAISQQIESNGTTAVVTSTAQVNGLSVASPPSKKRRLEDNLPTPADDTTNGLKRSSSLKRSGSNARKNVTFTPETKEDDGESSAFMQDKWDEEARNDQINDFLAREAELAEAEAAANLQKVDGEHLEKTDPAMSVKKPKREKKEKRPTEQPTPDLASPQLKSTTKSKDALDYLQQYQTSRSTWKFNKNREVWLLKHILSKSDIPSSYEPALLDYLSGMKSGNAKARLLDQCHDCIVNEVESGSDDSDRAIISKSLKMDSTARRLAYYRAANHRFETVFQETVSGEVSQKDRDLARSRHERIDRATKLLESMLVARVDESAESDFPVPRFADVASQVNPLSVGIAGKPAVKKRKNRTAVVDISSSDDTSSDSSSDLDT